MSRGPSPVRASTSSRVAAAAKATCRFVPASAHPPPSAGRAVVRTPAGPNPPSGSSHAGVRITSPDATPGNHAARCASVPPATSAPAPATQLAKCGVGASARPSSS